MKALFLLVHAFPAVLSYGPSIQPVGPLSLGFDKLAVVAPELLDLEAVIRGIQNPLVLQRAASDTIGIGVMVLGDTMVISVGFGIPAGRDVDLTGEPWSPTPSGSAA